MTGVLRPALVLLLVVTMAACAARGAVPRPFPGAAVPPGAGDAPTDRAEAPSGERPEAPAPPADSGLLSAVLRTALGFLGTPYRNGGSDPSGFDCSGFVQYIFERHGTALPREVRDQYRAGREVDLRGVKPGDLLFFETVARGASHVGIALGDGRFVHAPSSRGVIRVEPYTANYWARRFVGARRVAETERVNASARPSRFPGSIRVAR